MIIRPQFISPIQIMIGRRNRGDQDGALAKDIPERLGEMIEFIDEVLRYYPRGP